MAVSFADGNVNGSSIKANELMGKRLPVAGQDNPNGNPKGNSVRALPKLPSLFIVIMGDSSNGQSQIRIAVH
jgi:hypothetical protein